MPTANFYSKGRLLSVFDGSLQERFRAFAADRLSCGEIALSPDEISVRLIEVDASSQMMGELECDIHAHEFTDRVEQQDEICRDVAAFLERELDLAGKVRVWLVLSQLGHSV